VKQKYIELLSAEVTPFITFGSGHDVLLTDLSYTKNAQMLT